MPVRSKLRPNTPREIASASSISIVDHLNLLLIKSQALRLSDDNNLTCKIPKRAKSRPFSAPGLRNRGADLQQEHYDQLGLRIERDRASMVPRLTFIPQHGKVSGAHTTRPETANHDGFRPSSYRGFDRKSIREREKDDVLLTNASTFDNLKLSFEPKVLPRKKSKGEKSELGEQPVFSSEVANTSGSGAIGINAAPGATYEPSRSKMFQCRPVAG